MSNDKNRITETCLRCGTVFNFEDPHTEFVRRDFVDKPRPARVEHLCQECWQAYVEDFLGEEFEYHLD